MSLGKGTDLGISSLYADSSSNKLYVGGYFKYADGNLVNSIAAWDGVSWSALGLGDSTCFNQCYPVNCITRFKGEIYAGGWFYYMGGKKVKGIARWNGSSWHSVDKGLRSGGGSWGSPRGFLNYNNDLIVYGSFDTAGSVPVSSIAIWNGSSWSPFDTIQWDYASINSAVYFNGEIFIAGKIRKTPSSNYEKILRWDGSNWHSIDTSLNGGMHIFTGHILILFVEYRHFLCCAHQFPCMKQQCFIKNNRLFVFGSCFNHIQRGGRGGKDKNKITGCLHVNAHISVEINDKIKPPGNKILSKPILKMRG